MDNTHHFHPVRQIEFPDEEMSTYTHWKFGINPGFQEIKVPRGARKFRVSDQRLQLVLHAFVDTAEVEAGNFTKMEVFLIETGQPLPARVVKYFRYLGAKRLTDSAWFYHIYIREVGPWKDTKDSLEISKSFWKHTKDFLKELLS